MSILLPSKPAVQTADPYLMDFGSVIRPPMGGPDQRFNRLGNRFGIDVVLPSARSDREGRIYVSRLMQALTEGALFAFVQDLDVGAPGASIAVNGAGQQGSTLNLKGFPSGYTVLEGQFFSIIYAGRRFLHYATADTAAAANGTMALPIGPMLRISPNDAAVCEFAMPMIEGFLANAQQLKWQLQTAPYADIKFTIEEAQ